MSTDVVEDDTAPAPTKSAEDNEIHEIELRLAALEQRFDDLLQRLGADDL